jgi:predicted secreted protein
MPLSNSTINAKDMPIELSFDSGVTWKVLVCLKDISIPLQTPVTAEDTYCGKKVGVGVIEFNPSGNAVCETRPDTDEVSHDDLVEYMDTGTSFLWRIQNPTSGSVGHNLYYSGSCKCTNVTFTGTANGLVGFSFTLTGEGTLDRTV